MSTTTNETALREFDGRLIPVAGAYVIDKSHSTVEFVARHLMISKVRGRFADFEGQIDIAEAPEQSTAKVTINAASVDTGDETRDGHLVTGDFFDVEQYPTLVFSTSRVEPAKGDAWKLHGELTVRGVSRPVVLDVEFDGVAQDPWGGSRIAFTATTELDREEWGLTWNQALEAGGVLVGKKVKVELAVQAVRQS